MSVVSLMVLAACGDDDDGGGGGGGGGGEETVKLSFANSYPDEHPHNTCGAQVVAETLADGGTGDRHRHPGQLGYLSVVPGGRGA
jgi:hypothetical protein